MFGRGISAGRLPQLSCCGPIEGLIFRVHGSQLLPFRNYHVAAPLKVIEGGVAVLWVVGLPQLSCCGPIEGPGRASRENSL